MATPTFTDDIFDTARYLLEPLKHDIEYSAPLLTRNKKQHKPPQYHNDVQTEIPGKRTVNMKAKAKARAARKRKR